MSKGDYVLATKYSDGDPADQWCVGYYIGPAPHDRHYVGDATGGPGPNGFRFSGFRCVDLIDQQLGEWFVRNAVELEKVPAGSINLRHICESRMKFLDLMNGDGTGETTEGAEKETPDAAG